MSADMFVFMLLNVFSFSFSTISFFFCRHTYESDTNERNYCFKEIREENNSIFTLKKFRVVYKLMN
jgi:hypothetical protein